MTTERTDNYPSTPEKSGNSDPPDHRSIRCDGGAGTEHEELPADDSACQIRIQNLGGIDSTERSLQPGISILAGRNATNRSSFLRSLAAGLGGDSAAAQLKTDAEEGSVELTIGEQSYTREYTKSGQQIQKQGTPYTTESAIVDTFVALFADCPARRAVKNGADLRDILMKPVDTAQIKHRISELTDRRDELDETIQRADQRKKELPELEQQRVSLQEELEAVETEISNLESVVDDIESAEDNSEATRDLRSKLESLRKGLNDANQRDDEIKHQLEFRRDERTELLEKRDELREEIADFEDPERLETRIETLESDISQLVDRRERLEDALEDLQSVIQANESFLEGGMAEFTATDGVTAQLDPDSQTVECWTCGSTVEQGAISDRVETLHTIRAQQRSDLNELEDEIAKLKSKRRTVTEQLDEYDELTRRREELDSRIEQHADKIEELTSDRDEIQTEIEQLTEEIRAVESEIEDTEESTEQSEFISAHKELTELERKRGRLENQLEEAANEIEAIERLNEERSEAEAERSEITDELADLRDRIDRLERELVETLNSIMEDLLERLGYKNIARVWLERLNAEGSGESSFKLHIVREAEDGAVYEDTASTLSESEREVLGLIISLAGYIVHDVDQTVPFLLLDSVEMIDGERLAHLLQYMKSETDVRYLCVALLPKDAESVEAAGVLDDHTTIQF